MAVKYLKFDFSKATVAEIMAQSADKGYWDSIHYSFWGAGPGAGTVDTEHLSQLSAYLTVDLPKSTPTTGHSAWEVDHGHDFTDRPSILLGQTLDPPLELVALGSLDPPLPGVPLLRLAASPLCAFDEYYELKPYGPATLIAALNAEKVPPGLRRFVAYVSLGPFAVQHRSYGMPFIPDKVYTKLPLDWQNIYDPKQYASANVIHTTRGPEKQCGLVTPYMSFGLYVGKDGQNLRKAFQQLRSNGLVAGAGTWRLEVVSITHK